jgi:nicotinamidase-related amidase
MTADDLDDDYAGAGFGGTVGFGARPALLLVDMVRAYVEPSSPLYAGVEDTVAPSKSVLDAARASGVPVIYTQVVYGPGGVDGGTFFKKVKPLELFVGRGELGRIVPELAPADDELVITKQYASAFFGTSLASTLTSLLCDTVIVMGYSTSGCVRASAVDATQHGFKTVVVRDAVGDRDSRPHDANLFDLSAKYADVVDSDRVVSYLSEVRG